MSTMYRVMLACGVYFCATRGAAAGPDVTPGQMNLMREAMPAKAYVQPAQPRRVLVYNDCKGFRHSSIPHGAAALKMLGATTGAFEAVISDDPAVFAAESLRRFDAVCFNNTTGELLDDAAVRQGLLDFVRSGKGIVGIHAATDCFYNWPAFGELMGGYFDGHPWHERVTIKLDDPAHPLVAMFDGKPFEVTDEIYQFRAPYSREGLRILLSLDAGATDMTKDGIKRDDGDFAVSWIRNAGRGRVFYCSLGHREEIFWNSTVLRHYLAGIQFAIGDLPADALPSGARLDDGWFDLCARGGLAGWICKPGAWSCEDGVLTRNGGGDLWTEQTFGDFVLDLEFKVAPGANSGIFFRTGNIDDCVQTGIELQVLDSYGKPEAGKHDAGAIYDCLAPRKNAVRPAGAWNRVVLTCRGSRVQVVMNGEDIIDMNLDDWTQAGKNPDASANKFKTAYRDMPRRGRIGFQDHGNPVWYRTVRIKPLD